MLLYSSSFCWITQAGLSANLSFWHLGALISKLSLEVSCWTALYIEPGLGSSAVAAFVKAPLGRFASLLWACETPVILVVADKTWPLCFEMPFVSKTQCIF